MTTVPEPPPIQDNPRIGELYKRPSKPKRRWILPTAIGAGAFLFGLGVGTSSEPTTPTAEPTTVTKTVTAEPVAQVPQACLNAVDAGDQVLAAFNYILGWSEDILTAVSEFDAVEMGRLNEDLNATSGQYAGVIPTYETAAAECRAAS